MPLHGIDLISHCKTNVAREGPGLPAWLGTRGPALLDRGKVERKLRTNDAAHF
jgi:hypothetical protein